jgi:glycosyltransferase involved in cell wall biosynthesis
VLESDATSRSGPLRVILSMLTFVPGGMGGSETYARELVKALSAVRDVSVATLVPESARSVFPEDKRKVVPGLIVGASSINRILGLLRIASRARRIRKSMASAEVVHYPFTVPGVFPRGDQARVVTVHDVQHRDLPHLFSPLERLFRVFAYERSARKADAVITVSQFAKNGIVKNLHIPADRVFVAPLGVDASLFTPNLDTRDPFVLYPARGWPHKNHSALIEAVKILRRTHPEFRLVLTGGNLEHLTGAPEWVDIRGLVSSEELHSLYRTASVLAFPSLYEGFGLPPLEAMASGCPVAASNVGSIPEVVGDAAVLFDPLSPDSIASGIIEALSRKEELVQAGLSRVNSFTWNSCAIAHVRAYRQAQINRLSRKPVRGA